MELTYGKIFFRAYIGSAGIPVEPNERQLKMTFSIFKILTGLNWLNWNTPNGMPLLLFIPIISDN